MQSPAERVIERSVVVTRTVTEARGTGRAPKPLPTCAEPSAAAAAARSAGAAAASPSDLTLDRRRDALLTAFGKATLTDRYLLPGESFQDMFARVSCAYRRRRRARPAALRLHVAGCGSCRRRRSCPMAAPSAACRSPASSTPCRIRWTASSAPGTRMCRWPRNGGGIGTYWGKVRSIGEKVKTGETSGIIPFIHVMDGLTLAISQGSLRRGSAAVYLDIHHPEIEEFLEIRKASGDFNRKGLNLHHGINITDEFMEAVRDGKMFGLRSPKTSEVHARGRCPPAVAAHPGNPPADRRALYPEHRHGEPRPAQASARAGPEGHDLQPVQRDHAADRHRSSTARSAPRCAACRRSTSRPGTSGATSRASSRTCMRILDNVLTQLHRRSRPTAWSAPAMRRCASARSGWA